MQHRRLSSAQVAALLPRVSDKLRGAERKRLEKILTLFEEDRLRLSRLLQDLYPAASRENAQTALRNLRKALSQAAHASGVDLQFKVDTNLQYPPEARWCWFEGEDCAITGYGCDGPLARKAGHDINYLARCGILSYSGLDGRPCIPGVQIADLGGGALLAAFSIVTALFARERIRKGQFIDVGMADGALTWHVLRWGKYLADGELPSPGDDVLNHGFACYNLYATRDGRYMSLGALEPQFWKVFCESVGHPEWNRPNYFEPGAHQKILQDQLEPVFPDRNNPPYNHTSQTMHTSRPCGLSKDRT